MIEDSNALKGLRLLLINPRIWPADLRGESHLDDKWKSERAMNFGLLVIASHLTKKGAEVSVIDLEEERADIAAAVNRIDPHLVGIGNISCYSALSVLEIIETCRQNAPGVKVMVGGQNASVSPGFFLNAKTPPDWIVVGPGELTSEHISRAVAAGREPEPRPGLLYAGAALDDVAAAQPGLPLPLEDTAFLLYDLYPNWRRHFPLIEESRGCPFACQFCANPVEALGSRRYRMKPPSLILEELARAANLWGVNGELPAVLMCANFGTRAEDTRSLLADLQKSDRRYKLLAAMRVDVKWERYVDLMEGVFDQIHFGLESASPEILLRMNKATHPELYLDKASQAFRKFKEAGLHVACNFILGYPGENGRTLFETMAFLIKNQPWIDSLWGGALIEYPGAPFTKDMERFARAYGTRRRRPSDLCDRLGAWPIDPSHSLSHENVAQASLLLMKMFNSRRGFYEHYRWYPGPEPTVEEPLAFYEEGAFFDLFLRGGEAADYGFDALS